MSAAPQSFPASVHVPSSRIEHRNRTKGMSSGKFSGRSEVTTYRQFFAKRWQSFIVENFESPAHAALAFRVDPSTAQNWFEGLNAPQGWVVGKAISDPALQSSVLQHIAAE